MPTNSLQFVKYIRCHLWILMVFPKFPTSKFKIIQIAAGIVILALLILFISNRLAFLISVLNRVLSPGEPTTGKIEIDVAGLKLLNDKISFPTSSVSQ